MIQNRKSSRNRAGAGRPCAAGAVAAFVSLAASRPSGCRTSNSATGSTDRMSAAPMPVMAASKPYRVESHVISGGMTAPPALAPVSAMPRARPSRRLNHGTSAALTAIAARPG